MNYINLIQEVAKRTGNEQIEDNFDIQSHTDNYERANYLAKYVHRQVGWDALFNVVFGDDLQTSNDGVEGLYEFYVTSHTGFIQNKSEHGTSRTVAFKSTMNGEPEWAKEVVAESELDYWQGTDPEFWSERNRDYVIMLERITR